jgi:putative transposase
MHSPLTVPGKGTEELRKGRFSGRNQIYHITTVTLDRYPVFSVFLFARIAIRSMLREDDAGHTQTLAYALMPDHLHWLFQLNGDRSLSTCVNTIKSYATRKINGVSDRSGRLWRKGFHDRAIRREEDLEAVARYIVANPLRAGIARSVREYPHWDAVWV